jgi:hypothetical protein
MGKKNKENIGKALRKEGGEDRIKLGLERDMEVETERHKISDMARIERGEESMIKRTHC